MSILYENVVDSYDGTHEGGPVSEIEHYTGRILVDSVPTDIVFMSRGCEGDYEIVEEHYRQAGLRTAKQVIFTNKPTRYNLDSWPDHRLVPFLMNQEMARWCGDFAQAKVVSTADDKNWAVATFQECGISHPDTICFEAGGLDTLTHFDGPRIFKPARGATKIGQAFVNDVSDLYRKVESRYLEDRFQLQQPVVDLVAEGSVQSRIIDRQPRIIAITGQYVGKGGHCGNYFPMRGIADPERLQKEAMLFLQRLAILGIRDYQSVDFLVDAAGQFYFTDPNIRRGGATGPTRVAERLGLKSWFNRLTATKEASCQDLDLVRCPLTFTRERGEGIILTSAFTRKKKGVMFVCSLERLPYWQREAAAWLQSDELKEARLAA